MNGELVKLNKTYKISNKNSFERNSTIRKVRTKNRRIVPILSSSAASTSLTLSSTTTTTPLKTRRMANTPVTLTTVNSSKKSRCYGQNDLSLNLSTAILILSPKLSSTIKTRKNYSKSKSSVSLTPSSLSNLSTSRSSVSSSLSSSMCTNHIEKRRCCNVNSQNNACMNQNNKNSQLIETINDANNLNNNNRLKQYQKYYFSDDDGFHSDSQKLINSIGFNNNQLDEIGFKNQIKFYQKSTVKQSNNLTSSTSKISTTIKDSNCLHQNHHCKKHNQQQQQQESNLNNNIKINKFLHNSDFLTTFNINMASTPKSIRKFKHVSSRRKISQENEFKLDINNNNNNNTTLIDGSFTLPTVLKPTMIDTAFPIRNNDELTSTKYSTCNHLHGATTTATTTTTTTCHCCCCCCNCCCSSYNKSNEVNKNFPIYLARCPSGYKLVQVIDDKIIVKPKRKLNNELKKKVKKSTSETRKYRLKSVANKELPLSLKPIENVDRNKIINGHTMTTAAYDITSNQVVNCNAYIKELFKKTKKLKTQAKKKTSANVLSSIKEQKTENNSVDNKIITNNVENSARKRKLSNKIGLFQQKARKCFVKNSDVLMANSNENEILSNLKKSANHDSIENRSFLQESFLTDFNQYGQFRIWYV